MEIRYDNTFAITSDIQPPNRRSSFTRKIMDTLFIMKAGDSFFVPNATPPAIYNAALLARVKVTVRKATENSVSGYRVWRTH